MQEVPEVLNKLAQEVVNSEASTNLIETEVCFLNIVLPLK